MSLVSTSQSFTLSTSHRVEDMPAMPEVYVCTDNLGVSGSREAFMKAMQEFADSEHFEKFVHQLYNEFDIRVKHLVHLSMPE